MAAHLVQLSVSDVMVQRRSGQDGMSTALRILIIFRSHHGPHLLLCRGADLPLRGVKCYSLNVLAYGTEHRAGNAL